MPLIGLLHLLIAIGCMYHAQQIGRPQFWFYILLFLPGVGAISYLLFEIVPEMANTRRGRRVATDVRTIFNPNAEWDRLYEQFQKSDSVAAKCALAEECERKNMWSEAATMYTQSLQGMYAEDADLLRGLARAQLGGGDAAAAMATLERLRVAHPGYQNQNAHLTYARALEAQGRLPEARQEFHALSVYFVGTEARARYGLLLKMGEPAAARKLFGDIVQASGRGVLTDDDKDWLKVAKQNL